MLKYRKGEALWDIFTCIKVLSILSKGSMNNMYYYKSHLMRLCEYVCDWGVFKNSNLAN